VNQIEKIIEQLEILKKNLNGKNAEGIAVINLYEGRDIDVRGITRTIFKNLIFTALRIEGGNQIKAAKRVGVSEGNLRYQLRKFTTGVYRKKKR